ncbi:hypothetical protein [Bacterioplanoides sp.]|uniref:hypothetical protein n=1 Tax=Bacterioplanoides sp. TaxID=2066072 RepID=UPI003B002BAC
MKALFLLSILILSGCASNHHLVFFTNSTIGIEIGSEPNTGSPVKFIVGYKRQEGVIDPLIPDYSVTPSSRTNRGNTTQGIEAQKTLSKDNGTTNIIVTPDGTFHPQGSKVKAHSVLAKMNFGATGGSADSDTSQWFATGKAAELLAGSPGITGAISGNPENNVESRKVLTRDLNTENLSYLLQTYDILVKYSANNQADQMSKKILQEVNSLDQVALRKSFTEYSWSSATDINSTPYNVAAGNSSFSNVVPYINELKDSLEVAKSFLSDNNITINGAIRTNNDLVDATQAVSTYNRRYEEGVNALFESKSVLEMIDFVHSNILLTQ